MTRKKGKLLTFLWSLIPGAGEMYLGFFKQGISLMALFAIILGLSGFLQLSILSFLTPIIWFYSFFHTNNLNSLPDDEFYALEDDFLIHWSDITDNKAAIKKYRKLLAICLIFFGVSILWNNFSHLLFWYLLPSLNISGPFEELLRFIARSIPQAVIAIAVIVAGIFLIRGKYEELTHDDSTIPAPPYLNDKEGSL